MSLKTLVAQVLRIPEDSIADDASTKTLKAWNSTRHVELVMALEKHYQLRFSTAEMVSLQSLARIREALAKRDITA